MTKNKVWDKNKWVRRKFRCNKTGEELIIPESVRSKDFYEFGDGCFIDTGDGYYSRWGGDFSEIKDFVLILDPSTGELKAHILNKESKVD